MLTADGKTLKCHGYSRIKVDIVIAEPMLIDAPIVEGQLFGF